MSDILSTLPVQYILAIDVETSGQTWRDGDLIEAAFTVWRLGDKAPLSERYYFFGLDGIKWEARTREEFWDNAEKGDGEKTPYERLVARLERDNVPVTSREDAAADLTRWARAWDTKTGGSIVVVSDTSGFDYGFVSDLLDEHKKSPKMPPLLGKQQPPHSLSYLFGKYRDACAINSFYFGVGGVVGKRGSRDRMLARYNLVFPDWVKAYDHSHHPLDDSKSIGAMASFLLPEIARIAQKDGDDDSSGSKKRKSEAE
jgi:hypothetical protein